MKPAFLRPAANFIPNLRNGRANELLNYSVASRKVGGGKNGLGVERKAKGERRHAWGRPEILEWRTERWRVEEESGIEKES